MMDSKSLLYTRVPSNDEVNSAERNFFDSNEILPEQRRRYRYLPAASVVNTILLLVVLILTCSSLLQHQHSVSHHPVLHTHSNSQSTQCGNTTATAKAAGCLFDPLGYLWTPPECYDHLTASEFRTFLSNPNLQFGAFPFFRTNDTSDRISSEDELSERLGMKTYSTQQEHLAHCAYMLRRLERAREGKVRWDGKGGYAHIEHCSNSLVERLVEGENPLDRTGLHSVILLNVVEEC